MRLLRIALALLVPGALTCRAAQQQEKEVWVEVTVLEGRYGEGADEFYGSIAMRDFVPLVDTVLLDGYLKLNNTAWTEGRNIIAMAQARGPAGNFGYTNTVYLRKSLITCVIPLDDSFVKERLLPALQRGRQLPAHPAAPLRLALPKSTPLPPLLPMSFDLKSSKPDSLLK